jgi:hypothetical protein
MILADTFYDPMGNEWSVRSVAGKWDLIKTKITTKDGKKIKSPPEVIDPKMASSKHSALAKLFDLIEFFGWDKLKANKGRFEPEVVVPVVEAETEEED